MRILSGLEEITAEKWMNYCAELATHATCLRSRGGAVLVHEENIIGFGYNSPPGNIESQRRCNNSKESYDKKVTDKTCCVHAEQRAMFDALRKNPTSIQGAQLYFVRINNDNQIIHTREPYCTICSKMALDLGVKEFLLYKQKGIVAYLLEEYNDHSYNFKS